MIQEIKSTKSLINCLRTEIEDEGINVEIDNKIKEEQLAIIKVDDYYNGLHIAKPPKAIDDLVVVDCECDWYVLYLLELKNVNSSKGLVTRDIQEKFENTIKKFMEEDFSNIFLKSKYKYREIFLYLVSDAYGLGKNYESYEEYKKVNDKKSKAGKKDSLKIEVSLGSKLFRFGKRILRISYEIPPNPLIRRYL